MTLTSTPMTLTSSNSPLLLGLLLGLTAVAGGLILAFGGPIVAVALLLAGIAALVVLRDIEVGFWGVIAVITLLPFATLPFKIVITPSFLDLALAAVIGVWVLRIVTGRQETIITAPVTVPIILFLIVAVFAFIFGMSNGPLTSNLLRKFAELLLSIGFVLVIVDYCRTWRQLERLVKAFLLAGAGAGALGIGIWLLPDEMANQLLNLLVRLGYPGGWVIRYIEENPELAERAIGTAVDPNVFGGMLVLLCTLAAPQLVAEKPLFPRWLTWLIFGLMVITLLLTFSRGAFVALAGGLGFIALARYRRLLPYMLVGGLLLLFLPITQEYVARLVAGFTGQDLATQMRFGEYRDAWALMMRYPLFGVGFAGSPDLDLYLGVAMVYLTIGQQMGFLGLAAFTAVISTVFLYALSHRHLFRNNPDLDPIWLGLHAALISGLVAGIFDHYLFNLEFLHAVTAFWMLLGMATAATRLGVAESHPPK
jgi:polysaccharide biosynthesis protein PslJ